MQISASSGNELAFITNKQFIADFIFEIGEHFTGGSWLTFAAPQAAR